MAERLAELYQMLVGAEIPPNVVERFILDLNAASSKGFWKSRSARRRCVQFLRKYHDVIELAAAARQMQDRPKDMGGWL